MSEVMRMLEGDDLTEKWEASQKIETPKYRSYEILPQRYSDLEESSLVVEAMELSGPRECNRVADNLSKMLQSMGYVELRPEEFGEDLQKIVDDDASGKIYFRGIKKHFSRKHCEKKWKCGKKSDYDRRSIKLGGRDKNLSCRGSVTNVFDAEVGAVKMEVDK
ncbi:hypothetical protein GIB67_024942 [Kingdonia uniflora]|uniref:Uncharacterized protein n=1 Tax=Kingdonia uniflora TaxID=39325 RepID=A0A7J7NZ06_9MAGN|nr:hypothetical protein GIB67_024942 [Kingdonia uniflora]